MSRGGPWDSREVSRGDGPARTADRTPTRPRSTRRPDVPIEGLDLPRGDRREDVPRGDRVYQLRGSETRILATVGTFRVVPAADLADRPATPHAHLEDVRRLSAQGLLERRTIPINQQPTSILVLTRDGKALLESRREAAPPARAQQYHAGLVKPRELAHDAQLYRMYQAEAGRIEDQGGRITRVVLDYELKRDYQTFLHRRDRRDEATLHDDIRAFATAQQLPIVDGHLELPDVRIEYDTADGRSEIRDLELVTEHYSRAQMAGKARAGFGLYRAGAGRPKGGTPTDPHYLEDLA